MTAIPGGEGSRSANATPPARSIPVITLAEAAQKGHLK